MEENTSSHLGSFAILGCSWLWSNQTTDSFSVCFAHLNYSNKKGEMQKMSEPIFWTWQGKLWRLRNWEWSVFVSHQLLLNFSFLSFQLENCPFTLLSFFHFQLHFQTAYIALITNPVTVCTNCRVLVDFSQKF
jgi:hypothetical protein